VQIATRSYCHGLARLTARANCETNFYEIIGREFLTRAGHQRENENCQQEQRSPTSFTSNITPGAP